MQLMQLQKIRQWEDLLNILTTLSVFLVYLQIYRTIMSIVNILFSYSTEGFKEYIRSLRKITVSKNPSFARSLQPENQNRSKEGP